MRLISLQVIFLIILSSLAKLNAANPIITQKYTADPSAMVHDGRVYVYCSNDDNNTLNPDGSVNYRIKEYTLISSDDLVNWTDHGEVFKVPRDASWASLAYAPSCVAHNGKFYLYFPDGGDKIGVAVADSPIGPFTDPVGSAIVHRGMPNCDVEWCFDPAAFIDDDGQAYLYFGGGMNTVGTNLRVIKLNADMISTSGSAISIDAPNSFEAAYMHKHNDTYYFSYATDGASKFDYMTSDNPTTGFQHKGTILENPTLNGQNINCYNNNHASIITFNNNWYMFYHDRRISGESHQRNVCVDMLTYNTDGTIKKVTVTADGAEQIKNLNPFNRVEGETIGVQKGITTGDCSEGGRMVTEISAGDWIRYIGVDFENGAEKFEVRVASESGDGSIELHLDSENGALVGTCDIAATGGWTDWETVECTVSDCSGVKDLVLVFKGSGEPFRVNWFRFSRSSGVLIKSIKKKSTVSGPTKIICLQGHQIPFNKDVSLFNLLGQKVQISHKINELPLINSGVYVKKQ